MAVNIPAIRLMVGLVSLLVILVCVFGGIGLLVTTVGGSSKVVRGVAWYFRTFGFYSEQLSLQIARGLVIGFGIGLLMFALCLLISFAS